MALELIFNALNNGNTTYGEVTHLMIPDKNSTVLSFYQFEESDQYIGKGYFSANSLPDVLKAMDFTKYDYRISYSSYKGQSALAYLTALGEYMPFTVPWISDGAGRNIYIYRELKNKVPTISLASPITNITLYENDTLSITGTARDEDANQSVTVYYQINNETRRVLATDVSQKNIALSKQLTIKGGKLYDGQTAVTGALTDGVAHKLKVWAVDDQGGTSTIVERTFYVVPNRAPVLTVNTPVINGIIDTDKIQLNGTYSDPDNNTCTVSYKINGGNGVQIASGVSGNWNFEIPFSALKVGTNTIVVENIDSYGAKTSKTIKLNKNEVKTPLLKSTARYKLTPATGSAKGVLLYVQRDTNLVIDAKISMKLVGEPESFVAMTLENTAPMPNKPGIVEDEFYLETAVAKDNIILQIDMQRSSIEVSDAIKVIQGAFE